MPESRTSRKGVKFSEKPDQKFVVPLDEDNDSDDQTSKIKINKAFKQRFEDQERKRELQYLESKGLLEGSDDSESESSESDDEVEEGEVDVKLAEVIASIRRKDPKIYDKEAQWFDGAESDKQKGKKQPKKQTFKDVVRSQILEDSQKLGMADPGEDGWEADKGHRGFAYDEEQRNLRKAFLSSVGEEQDEENSNSSEDGNSSEEEENELKDGMTTSGLLKKKTHTADETGVEGRVALHRVLDGDEEADRYLKDFFGKAAWKSNGMDSEDSDEDGDVLKIGEVWRGDEAERPEMVDEDEEEVDRMEQFESKFNFRFEEQEAEAAARKAAAEKEDRDDDDVLPDWVDKPAVQVKSFARGALNGSLRKPEEKRKLQREQRKERKALERQKKEEELRRLKNLKKQEIMKKLSEIDEVAGGTLGFLSEADLDEDFDPDKFDQAMQKAFDEEYYSHEDPNFKPALSAVEEEQEVVVAEESGEGKDWNGEEEMPTGEWDEGQVEELKSKASEAKELMEQLNRFEYDDLIGDMPTRFKYTQVQPEDFGLTAEEILLADDKELNAFVSLKKLAPYRTDGVKLTSKRRKAFRQALRARLKEVEHIKPPTGEEGEGEVAEEDEPASSAGKKRRRKRKGAKQAEEDGADGDHGDGQSKTAPSKLSEREPEELAPSPPSPAQESSNEPSSKRKRTRRQSKTTSSSSGSSGGVGQKKDSKKKKIKGVKTSRLAAYGL